MTGTIDGTGLPAAGGAAAPVGAGRGDLPAALLTLSPVHLADALFGPAQRERLDSLVRLGSPRVVTDFAQVDGRTLAATRILLTGWSPPRIDEEVLGAMPSLELVAHMGGGHPDGALLERHGVRVVGQHQRNAVPTAEYAAAMILLANKQAFRAARAYRREQRFLDREVHFLDSGNHESRVGIVGAGAVGRHVIGLLSRHDLEILVHDPALGAGEAAALGVRRADLAEIFASCRVVSLHAAVTAQTRRMIGAELLRAMREGATLVNTARGQLVDQEALVAELRTGRIDAVLDVTDPDVLPAGHPLYSLANVHLTPHIAGSMGRELHRLADAALDTVAEHLAAPTPPAASAASAPGPHHLAGAGPA